MSRNHALDGLRGLAALAVALGHCNLTVMGVGAWAATVRDYPSMPTQEIVSSLLYVVFPADAAVTLFFVLSGHVLWRSFKRRQPGSLLDLPDYLIGRAYRLLPVAIASTIPLGFLVDAKAWDLAANMLLLSNSVNGALWSLQVEAVCSLAIFLAWLLAGGSPLRLVGLLVGVLIASQAVRGSSVLLFFPAFLLGALIDDIPERFWGRAAFAAGLGALVLAHVVIPSDRTARHVEMLGAAVVVGCMGRRPLALLLSRPVQFLGAISYPFYLTHFSGLMLTHHLGVLRIVTDPFARMALLALVSIPPAIVLAWFLHKTVERPAMQVRPKIRRLALPFARKGEASAKS